MPIKILTVLLAASIFLFVVELIRREKLTFKYAFGWMLMSLAAVILAIFDQAFWWTARLLGFQLASNFIFFSLFGVFIFLSLFLTIFLCQQNNRNDVMAQKIATLEFELDRLRKQLESKKT